ncbi:MAG: tryptophan-rich sensory protein [Proteobacteria bacterium]|nr:tryptophan-rich sensory protein [Pseudomonadota bacterium]HQR03926.1 tryptophan-rich sensory protein [Rhodocyclaceae bacterium]
MEMFDLSALVFLGLMAVSTSVGAYYRPAVWHEDLHKPWWAPPDWFLPAMWSLIFIGVGLAGWLVWRSGHEGATVPLVLWGIQLVLCAIWSWIFYVKQSRAWAFIDNVAIIIASVGFIVTAWPFSQMASCLFSIYLLWTIGAASVALVLWKTHTKEHLERLIA